MERKTSFTTGAIALVFLLIGYQSAVFIHKAAATRIASLRDRPDTVYVVDSSLAASLLQEEGFPPAASSFSGAASSSGGAAFSSGGAASVITIRRNADHSAVASILPKDKRRIESFRFDPNTVSVSDLQRLGFSEKQAASIDNYRNKGGRFRRPSDFAKSYVVADSVFERLEPYISIPKVDINLSDSAAFDALPGIGPYFASKMVSYRTSLRGYSYPEQLMDIYHFDRERFDGLSDLITLSPPEPYPLWALPEEELRTHPYIGRHAARSIVLFRENTPSSEWSVEALFKAGILDSLSASRLSRCRLAAP
ncbi:MAG: helix-hairpin-helix domain-containing protein [Bacteroidales bacterium]|nr:helix-hairpin-helix domain-containing protein [Bacteroidales bacterium]